MEKMKKRTDYIDGLKPGSIVAYKKDEGMYTGKVVEVLEDTVSIQTLNKSIYIVKKDDVVWVKLGSHWPIGISNAIMLTKKQGY